MKKIKAIYQIGHYGFFDKCIIHYLHTNSDKKALFLIDVHITCNETKKFIEKLKQKKLPFEICSYDDSIFFSKNEKECRQKVINFFEDVLDKYGIILEECLCYSGFDTYSAFTAYLCLKNKQYSIFDFGNNMVSVKNRFECNMDAVGGYTELMKSTQCLHIDNSNVIEIIWNITEYDSRGKKSTIVDYEKNLKEITEKKRYEIYNIFEMPNIAPGDYCLIIMSSSWVIPNFNLTYCEFFDTYKIIADYVTDLTPSSIIIKQHPNFDIGEKIKNYFKKGICLNGYFPMSLISCFEKINICTILSTGSTGSQGYNSICFPLDILKNTMDLHLIYWGNKLSQKNKKNPKYLNQQDNDIAVNLIRSKDNMNFVEAMTFTVMRQSHKPILDSCDVLLLRYLNDFINNVQTQCSFYELIVITRLNTIEDLGYAIINSNTIETLDDCKNLLNYDGKSTIKSYFDLDDIFVYLMNEYYRGNFTSKLTKEIEQNSLKISNWYRYGTYLKKNLNKAYLWAKLSADSKIKWANNEIFEICWEIGTPESYKIMIDSISDLADMGDGSSLGQMGLAYCYGKGVPKDLTKSAEFLRKSVNCGIQWARKCLFDTLWMIGTDESYCEMIDIISDLVKNGDKEAIIRLSNAYREGKGVPQDIFKSNELLKKITNSTK